MDRGLAALLGAMASGEQEQEDEHILLHIVQVFPINPAGTVETLVFVNDEESALRYFNERRDNWLNDYLSNRLDSGKSLKDLVLNGYFVSADNTFRVKDHIAIEYRITAIPAHPNFG